MKKKASRAKKAAAAATRNTAPSPPQEVEPELRMPTMPAWLSAFVQRFWPVPVVAQEVPARKKQGKPERKGPRGFQAKMYGFPRKSPAALARAQEPAARILSRGPTITELLAKDAEVVDPYEQKALQIEYHTIRPRSGSEWDFCSVCYFEDSKKIRQNKEALGGRFETEHYEGGAWERCSVCMAMFFRQHLKWHIQYCHPRIPVK